jgi:hypothetical protein
MRRFKCVPRGSCEVLPLPPLAGHGHQPTADVMTDRDFEMILRIIQFACKAAQTIACLAIANPTWIYKLIPAAYLPRCASARSSSVGHGDANA